MSEIDAKIASIKARREAAQIAKVRAEATKETAQASYDAAMARLSDEFGVDSLAVARGKLTELQADLQAQLDEITEVLDEIEL